MGMTERGVLRAKPHMAALALVYAISVHRRESAVTVLLGPRRLRNEPNRRVVRRRWSILRSSYGGQGLWRTGVGGVANAPGCEGETLLPPVRDQGDTWGVFRRVAKHPALKLRRPWLRRTGHGGKAPGTADVHPSEAGTRMFARRRRARRWTAERPLAARETAPGASLLPASSPLICVPAPGG
jgi:hypothetical protein